MLRGNIPYVWRCLEKAMQKESCQTCSTRVENVFKMHVLHVTQYTCNSDTALSLECFRLTLGVWASEICVWIPLYTFFMYNIELVPSFWVPFYSRDFPVKVLGEVKEANVCRICNTQSVHKESSLLVNVCLFCQIIVGRKEELGVLLFDLNYGQYQHSS